MARPTPTSIMEVNIQKALLRKPEASADQTEIVHIIITGPEGGFWTVDLSKKNVRPGLSGVPDTTMTMLDEDFVAMCGGELSPPSAVARKRLTFSPSLPWLSAKLALLLRG